MPTPIRPVTMTTPIRLLVAALLGMAVALLVSCGGSGKGLIPAAQAGPLQSDFEEVSRAAETGNGKCAATEAALGKTEQDFLALPSSVDRGLRARLEAGISNLRARALAMCAQGAPTTTATTPTTTATTSTTPTQTTSPTSTTPPPATPPSSESGGTAANGEEGEAHGKAKGEGKGEGKGKDEGKAEGGGEAEGAEGASGGASAGGASPEGGK